jgi:hypothetical protein
MIGHHTAQEIDPCAFTTAFGDGEYRFRLKASGFEELEEKCGVGIGAIYMRLHSPNYTFADVREAIRLALVGGGLPPEKALPLVKRYVDDRPIDESWLLARTIIGAAMHGVANDPAPAEIPPRAEAAPAPEILGDELSRPALSSVMKSRFGNGQQS